MGAGGRRPAPGCRRGVDPDTEPYLHRLVLAALSRLGIASSPAEDDAAEVKVVYREVEMLRPHRPGSCG